MSKTYWQIAAGSKGRDYSDLFLRFGMAFVGGEKPIAAMSAVEEGDVVVLKSGLSKILAAGPVVRRNDIYRGREDKDWLRDYDGWDLEAYCYVDWHVPSEPIVTGGLTRATIQKVHNTEHMTIADNLVGNLPRRPFEPEPHPTKPISDKEILKFLISEGLRPTVADELTNTFARIRLLAEYYYNKCDWDRIREHETRTFLIIPLLLSLGWAEQQMKIEHPVRGGRIDVACFSLAQHLPQSECKLIIESKGFASGLDYAPEQARRYALAFPACQVLVVSNGYCYKTFLRTPDNSFSLQPSAYLNLTRPRDRYPLAPDTVAGALEVLRWLLPISLY